VKKSKEMREQALVDDDRDFDDLHASTQRILEKEE